MDQPALNARDRLIDLLLELKEGETTTAELAATQLQLAISTPDVILRTFWREGLADRTRNTNTRAFLYWVMDEKARQALIDEKARRRKQRQTDWIIGANTTHEGRARDERFCEAILKLIESDLSITISTVVAITGDSRGTADTRLDRYRRLEWLVYAPQEDVKPGIGIGVPLLYAVTELGRTKFPELLATLKRVQSDGAQPARGTYVSRGRAR